MLPTELLLLIFEEIRSLDDLIAFCIAHDILGAVGEDTLVKRIDHALSEWNWAGDRVLCLGDSCQDDDLPPSVQVDVGRITTTLTRNTRADSAGADHSFIHFVHDHFTPPDLGHLGAGPDHGVAGPLGSLWLNGRVRAWSGAATMPARDQVKLDRILGMLAEAVRFPDVEGDDIVLCNLSKAEYVRGSAVKKLRDIVDSDDYNPYTVFFDLGIIALAYTAWSSDPTCSYNHLDYQSQLNLTRGKWAGDRFEVVQFDDMSRELVWKDTTEEAIEWLCELCEYDWSANPLSQWRNSRS